MITARRPRALAAASWTSSTLDAGMADDLELLLGELTLDRLGEAGGSLSRRIGDDVNLERRVHRGIWERSPSPPTASRTSSRRRRRFARTCSSSAMTRTSSKK